MLDLLVTSLALAAATAGALLAAFFLVPACQQARPARKNRRRPVA